MADLGLLIGNALSAFTQSRALKQEQEQGKKEKDILLKLAEMQLEDKQQRQAALERVGRALTGQGAPVPEYGTVPGGLGLERTGETAGPQGPPGQPNLLDLLVSGTMPEVTQMQQLQARSDLASEIGRSAMTPAEFLRSQRGAELSVQAGMTPAQLLSGDAQAFRPTANIQDFQFAQQHPDFQTFLTEMNQSKASGSAIGRGFGDIYTQIQQAGIQAPRTINQYSRMLELNNLIDTGKLAPAKTLIAELSQSLGVDVEGLDETQAFRALSNRVALELRNPAGGAGMPGAMSDRDRDFLIQSVPGLTLTKEGNRLIAEYAIKLAKRDEQVAQKARAYRQANGQIDEGFFDELQKWSNDNPLFTEADVEKAQGQQEQQVTTILYNAQGQRLD